MLYSAISSVRKQLTVANILAFLALIVSIPSLLYQFHQISEIESESKNSMIEIEQLREQIRIAGSQLSETRRLADAAKRSADTSSQQVDELSKSNILSEENSKQHRYLNYQRSRPRIEFTEAVNFRLVSNGDAGWTAKFTNTGTTPPLNVRTWVYGEALPVGSRVRTIPECHSDGMYHRGSFQNGTIFVNKLKLSDKDLYNIKRSNNNFVALGRLCYDDEGGGSHQTDFCISLSGTNESWSYVSCNGGNASLTTKWPNYFDKAIGSKSSASANKDDP